MANFTNNDYREINNAKESVPQSSSGTGTIQTKGTGVFGTGTLFKTEMQAGSWLIDLAQDELRKVISVDSDTSARLSNAFTLDLAALTTPDIISKDSLSLSELSVIAIGTDAIMNGVGLTAGIAVNMEKTGNSKGDSSSHVDPVIIDATGTIVKVLTQQ